jgi:hypothetical protein
MKLLYYIFDIKERFVGFANNEQVAKQMADGYGGKYFIGFNEEFIWNN